MYFGLVLNDRTLYLYIYYYINFAYTSARKILGFESEDITDSVENNELAAEGNGQAIGDGDVYPKRYVISNSDLYT
jgi:hypothetical protein